MRNVICTICLMLALLVSGCVERSLHWQTSCWGGATFMIPSLLLAAKNIEEVNAMMRVERETLAEDMQRKNPVYFIRKESYNDNRVKGHDSRGQSNGAHNQDTQNNRQ